MMRSKWLTHRHWNIQKNYKRFLQQRIPVHGIIIRNCIGLVLSYLEKDTWETHKNVVKYFREQEDNTYKNFDQAMKSMEEPKIGWHFMRIGLHGIFFL